MTPLLVGVYAYTLGELMRVLLAEDERPTVDSIDMLMEIWGYDLDVVSNGREAVDQVQAAEYDLVLMDTLMPIMTGYEAITRIRDLRLSAYLPILSLSATENSRQCLEVGADAFLEKPFDCDVLFRTIEQLTPKIALIRSERDGTINLVKEKPVSKDHYEALRELRRKNLGFFGMEGSNQIWMTHTNLQNRVLNDFCKGQVASRFLDRDPENYGLIDYYKGNGGFANRKHLLPEEFEIEKTKEDKELENFKEPASFAPIKEEGK